MTPHARAGIAPRRSGPTAWTASKTRRRRTISRAKIANAPQKIGNTSGYAGTSANISKMGRPPFLDLPLDGHSSRLRREVALRRADVDDIGSDQPVVRRLLEDVRGPAGGPGKREGGREEIGAEADAHEDRGRIELDVRLQRAVGMLLGEDLEDDVLDADGGLEPVRSVGHPLGHGTERGRPRV